MTTQVCDKCAGSGYVAVVYNLGRCASETCGKEFSWRAAGHNRLYCSDKCAKAQAQRQYRRRQAS